MSVLEIVTWPDVRLTTVCDPVETRFNYRKPLSHGPMYV